MGEGGDRAVKVGMDEDQNQVSYGLMYVAIDTFMSMECQITANCMWLTEDHVGNVGPGVWICNERRNSGICSSITVGVCRGD